MTETTHIPHPGSRLDAVAQASAQEQPPAEHIGTVTGQQKVVVPVAQQLPALGRGYVVILGPNNPVLRVLPQDPARRGAVILAIDSDVYLGDSYDGVQQAAGGTTGTTAGYLPAGIAVPVSSENAWFAGATNDTMSCRVSVWIFLDSE